MNTDIHRTFTAIYDAEADSIFRFCLLRVSDRERAMDIVQDTFLRFWQSLSDGKEIDRPRPFLFTVAHNLVIDWYRKKKAVSLEGLAGGGDGEGSEPYEPPQETFAADLELESEGRYLLGKIGELDPSYRQAVYLRFVEGLAPQDIAAIMGISANAASVRINRGLKELRAKTGY